MNNTDQLRRHIWEERTDETITVGLGSCIAFSANLRNGVPVDPNISKTLITACLNAAEGLMSLQDDARLLCYRRADNGKIEPYDIDAKTAKSDILALVTGDA